MWVDTTKGAARPSLCDQRVASPRNDVATGPICGNESPQNDIFNFYGDRLTVVVVSFFYLFVSDQVSSYICVARTNDKTRRAGRGDDIMMTA
jgi:hypothetical protein